MDGVYVAIGQESEATITMDGVYVAIGQESEATITMDGVYAENWVGK